MKRQERLAKAENLKDEMKSNLSFDLIFELWFHWLGYCDVFHKLSVIVLMHVFEIHRTLDYGKGVHGLKTSFKKLENRV